MLPLLHGGLGPPILDELAALLAGISIAVALGAGVWLLATMRTGRGAKR